MFATTGKQLVSAGHLMELPAFVPLSQQSNDHRPNVFCHSNTSERPPLSIIGHHSADLQRHHPRLTTTQQMSPLVCHSSRIIIVTGRNTIITTTTDFVTVVLEVFYRIRTKRTSRSMKTTAASEANRQGHQSVTPASCSLSCLLISPVVLCLPYRIKKMNKC